MGVHTEIAFSDLSYEKQQDLIEWVKNILYEDYKEEAEKAKNFGQNCSWQEAIVREYSINYQMWNDLSRDDLKNYNWELELQDYCEEEAKNRLYKAFKYTEVEIDIN